MNYCTDANYDIWYPLDGDLRVSKGILWP